MATFTVDSNVNLNVSITVVGTANNINWGDGSPLDNLTNGTISHTYGTSGTFTVTFDDGGITTLQLSTNNNITSLDVSGLSSLQTLYCQNNQLTSLDLTGCVSLNDFKCNNNNLTTLNLDNFSGLTSAYVYNNQLTSLSVNNCISLQNLQFQNNQITSIDISTCNLLNYLLFNNNKLSTTQIDNILSNLVNFGVINGTLIGNNQFPFAAPSDPTGLNNKQTLIYRGWTVTLDTISGYVVEVQSCVNQNSIYLLINEPVNIDDIVKYTLNDSDEIVCGNVNQFLPYEPTFDGTFVENLGSTVCFACFSATSVIREFQFCTGEDIGIYTAYFDNRFKSGDITSVQGFCLTVGDISTQTPEEPIYVPYRLTFPSCEDCYVCNGNVGILYETCDGQVQGYVNTQQLLPSGTVFQHPLSGCSTIIDYFYFAPYEPDNIFLSSMVTFDDCTECQNTTTYIYETEGCIAEPILIMSTNSYNQNDVIISSIGNGQSLCLTILGEFTGNTENQEYSTNYNNNVYPDGNCFECFGNNDITFNYINCRTNKLEFYTANLLNIVEQLFQEKYIFLTQNSDCLVFNPECVITQKYVPYIEIVSSFTGCTDCVFPNEISAGTEYKACVICCPCTTGQTVNQVSVPHPVWSNLQGQYVTLLDAVQLGGMNGLNS